MSRDRRSLIGCQAFSTQSADEPKLQAETHRILNESTNVRLFLHSCFDTIPDLAFLTVRTRMEEDALVLSYPLTRPVGMAIRTFQHLQSHFDLLGLADRYRLIGLEHLGSQYLALRRAYGAGGNAERVAEMLIEGAQDFEEVSGLNYWLAKLYRALAGNSDFCDGGSEAFEVQAQPQ